MYRKTYSTLCTLTHAHVSTTVYAVAAGTYAFYSFNVIMYGAILSLGVAVLYFYLVV